MRKSYATYLMNELLRKLAIGAVVSVLTATAHSGDRVDVWVLLTEPPIASGTSTPEAVKQQQQAVMAELKALGAVELGRVSTARNAIAVSIDQDKLPEVKRLSGVRSVSLVRDIRRDPVPPRPPVR
jgi:hypothetical protein